MIAFKEFDLTKKEPELCYIYYLYYKDHILYIGQTTNLHQRIASHRYDKIFDKCLYIEVPYKDKDIIETLHINKHSPHFNTKGVDRLKYKKFLDIGEYYLINRMILSKEDIEYEDSRLIVTKIIGNGKYYKIDKTTAKSHVFCKYTINLIFNKLTLDYGIIEK